uniref:Uncharacterized protein n=1 Tax=Heterosigma akashiwo TaxID=2829 RepID=A0A6V1VPE3_HETAK
MLREFGGDLWVASTASWDQSQQKQPPPPRRLIGRRRRGSFFFSPDDGPSEHPERHQAGPPAAAARRQQPQPLLGQRAASQPRGHRPEGLARLPRPLRPLEQRDLQGHHLGAGREDRDHVQHR